MPWNHLSFDILYPVANILSEHSDQMCCISLLHLNHAQPTLGLKVCNGNSGKYNYCFSRIPHMESKFNGSDNVLSNH